jgi:2-polyprenyl-3-methyl-5-hydroxy-6-metoxy-1,4-benzoquinol methylase
MDIKQAGKNWAELGETDPMWAILSADDKRGGKWNQQEFFATGREEIGQSLKDIQDAGVTVHRGAALDFGCGLGRLSQALAEHFQRVDGVDVSSSMVRQARQFNTHAEKVEYHVNCKTDLSLFPGNRFDFIYSHLVLQHIPTRHQLLYIAEFMQLLKAGGVAYFQTIHCQGLRVMFPNWFVEGYRLLKHRGEAYIPMYGVKSSEVEKVISKGGARLELKKTLPFAGYEKRFGVDFFLVVKGKV